MRLRAFLIKDDDLAVFYIAHILGADDVECACFGRKDRAAIESADHQRANAERVASAD